MTSNNKKQQTNLTTTMITKTNNIISYVLSIDKLRLSVRLGETEQERKETQQIDIYVKIFMKDALDIYLKDKGQYICYDKVCKRVSEELEGQEFRYIEYMVNLIYNVIRDEISRQIGEKQAKNKYIWLKVHKLKPPVDNLIGGASFEYSDLPESEYCHHYIYAK